MRWLKKIVLIVTGLFLLTVTGIGLYAWLRNDKLTAALVRKVNETINTKISYNTLRLTIFESFPNITVKFNNLFVSPSSYYDKTQFSGEDIDTLLSASSLSVTADLLSLLTGSVAVRSITVRDGEINLLTDKRGDINYEVFSGKKKSGGKNVRLNSISARNIKAVWSDRSSGLRIAGAINEATLDGEMFRAGIFLNAKFNAGIDSIYINGMGLSGFPVDASVKVRKTANSLSIAKGTINLAGLSFTANGMMNYSLSTLDLAVEGNKINIADLVSMLPEAWRTQAGGFGPSGIMNFKCSISGPYGDAGKPHIELNYDLTGGRVSNVKSGLKVNNLSFRGGLTNGALNSPETFLFTVDDLAATYGSTHLTGSFRLGNLARPHVTLALDGDINFDDLSRILKTNYISNQTGSVSGHIKLSGELPDSLKLKISSLPSLNPDLSFVFSDFGATLASSGMALSNASGSLSINKDLIADTLSFTLMDQRFRVNAIMRNFTEWIAGKPATLAITGDVWADRFVTAAFAVSKTDSTGKTGKSLNIFPPGVSMKVALKADSIMYMGFRGKNLTTVLEYEPYVYIFSDIRAEGLDGLLKGEFKLGKQKGGGYITKSKADVTGIDINKFFSAFNNFGQNFIVSDNLHGSLTGNTTVLVPLDSSYNIVYKSLVADAHLVIRDGRLVNFAPAESLSSYLDLDELKDISFTRMENDIFINNSTVSVPKMLINSTAVNFTVYGTHNFNDDYSYHARLLLSEVMSRKARDRNRGVIAFNQVQVDGAGKATIPLKIECLGGKITVGYDFGQAQDNIKEDIAVEKQTLKGILNEEYGWYETDTLKKKPAESKPKFKITWEEGKDIPPAKEVQQEEVKESPIKLLLKKKK
ncbi:MAG: AsmA-like C-terminal region-containing protein [Bacteroidales bacterium]